MEDEVAEVFAKEVEDKFMFEFHTNDVAFVGHVIKLKKILIFRFLYGHMYELI